MTTSLSDCLALATWLEASRAADGFGGPVAHWWRDCLVDCRPGHDWRYEGIVAGYLSLYAATGDEAWLARAGRAGDDVVAAQAPDGHYGRSQFEMNPGTAGTPHETGASIALLRLAGALSSRDPDASQRYARAAERNLRAQLDALWSPQSATLRDHAERDTFVPNKACTFVEAMLLLADATGSAGWIEQYALPIAEMVLAHQVRRPGSRLDGAIAQNSVGRQIVPKYFPYYVARCIPGLLALRRHDPDGRFADAALAAGRFVAATVEPDGAWPQVLYEDGRLIRFPRWVAAAGDVVRALELLAPLGQRADTVASRAWIAAGRLPNGGVRTAHGFAAQGASTLWPGPPDLRDLLPVAGWADKTLRLWAGDALTGRLGDDRAGTALDPRRGARAPDRFATGDAAASPLPLGEGQGEGVSWAGRRTAPSMSKHLAPGPAAPELGSFEAECAFLGRRLELRLDGASVDVRQRGRPVYRWRAGEPWAELHEPWMAAR